MYRTMRPGDDDNEDICVKKKFVLTEAALQNKEITIEVEEPQQVFCELTEQANNEFDFFGIIQAL